MFPKTAKELYQYCIEHHIFADKDKTLYKNVEIISKNITDDEDILFIFTGQLVIKSVLAIFVVTNKRLLYGAHKIFSGEIYNSYNLNSITDIAWANFSFDFGHLAITTIKEKVTFMLMTLTYNSIIEKLKEAVENSKNKTTANILPSTKSKATEIREYKALFDEGVITQEEFEAKKKQLLGL